MPHPDEGLIHAWLDGELNAIETKHVESLVTHDPKWAAAAAEARGLIAAGSRIVATLDHVAPNAVPSGMRRRRAPRQWMIRAAALLVIVLGVGTVIRLRGMGSPLIEQPHREPQSTQPLAVTRGVPALSQPTARAEPSGEKAPRAGAGKTTIVPTVPSEAKQVAVGASAARDLPGASAQALPRAEVPVQNPVGAAESSLAVARGGAAGAAPSRLAQGPAASQASAGASRKVEASSQPPAVSDASRDQPAKHANTRSAKSKPDVMSPLARTTSCFEVRPRSGLAARLLRLDDAELADSIRLGTLALRGDTLRLASGRDVAFRVSCPNP